MKSRKFELSIKNVEIVKNPISKIRFNTNLEIGYNFSLVLYILWQ